ncbi:hypothetical protein ACGFYF_37220 [Streptomyces lavendulae]|uniref:hypothetical protein n=1 Tax=Streptomyces lavendulae TaxID=1914 RepID=UPI003717468A
MARSLTSDHALDYYYYYYYAHFMPEAGGKGRAAIRALLGTVPEYVPEGLAVLGCQEFPSRNHGRPELGR